MSGQFLKDLQPNDKKYPNRTFTEYCEIMATQYKFVTELFWVELAILEGVTIWVVSDAEHAYWYQVTLMHLITLITLIT